MDVAATIALITELVPLARDLVRTLSAAGVNAGAASGTLDLISKLTPLTGDLVKKIEAIRTQTEADYPEVWASVRDDWMDAVAQWGALSPRA